MPEKFRQETVTDNNSGVGVEAVKRNLEESGCNVRDVIEKTFQALSRRLKQND